MKCTSRAVVQSHSSIEEVYKFFVVGIMSEDQIQQKKSLVLTNRIKRAAQLWVPLEMSPNQVQLLSTISNAFKESNAPPDTSELRVSTGKVII